MIQVFGDVRSGLVLLMALVVSGAGWWLVVAEPEALPWFICGVAGYEPVGLMLGRLMMWLAMMLAMALPVAVVIAMRARRVPDAAFLAGYAGTAAGVAVVAALVEWVVLSLGVKGAILSLPTGMLAGVVFAALGLLSLGVAVLRKSESCMQGTDGGRFGSHFSPAGRSAEPIRGDEGVAEGPAIGASRTPSSDPSGHLLPDGEKREQAAASRSNRFLHGLHQGRLSLTCTLTMAGLQLILGTMSLLLMLAMTLWMLAEALFPERRELPIALGAALITAGLSVIAVIAVT